MVLRNKETIIINENTMAITCLPSSVWRLYYNLPYLFKVPVNMLAFLRGKRKMLSNEYQPLLSFGHYDDFLP